MSRVVDLRKYHRRLKLVIKNALAAYEKAHGEKASIRKLAASIGQPGRHTTLYKWSEGHLSGTISDSSFSLLAMIDSEGRSQLELKAYLEGIDVEDLSPDDYKSAALALLTENDELKKRLRVARGLALA